MQLVTFNENERINKQSIAEIVEQLATLVEEGHINPREAGIRIKANEELLAGVKKRLNDLILDEASKYGKGENNYKGVEMTLVNGRKTYDFSGDAEWADLNARLKAREAYLKAMPKFNPETGEVSPVKEKFGKDYVTYKFPKNDRETIS